MRGYGRLVVINLAVLLAGAVGLLLVGEAYLRWSHGTYDGLYAAREKEWFRKGGEDFTRLYTLDAGLGFRPVLGSSVYDSRGIVRNDHSARKSPGVTRVLFIGDSVTFRGKIIDALRDVYGDERFEYLNAGVTSYNTIQEVEFFKRYNAETHPDHVVLTFHNNDFESTPIAFRNDDGKLVLYSPRAPRRNVNAWLFRNVMSYRAFLGMRIRDDAEGYRARIVSEIRHSLEELFGTLAANGVELSVIVLPILDRVEDWRDEHRRNHAQAIRLMEELGLRYFDLSEPLRQAFDDGLNPRENGDDTWHPNDQAAAYFARYLYAQGLLDPGGTTVVDAASRRE